MEIILIAAVDLNMGIGYKGDQLAYISEDLKRFKEMTMGHAVVMGRKTFEAMGSKGLPGRTNIVLTRKNVIHLKGRQIKPCVIHARSPAGAIAVAAGLGHEKIFVIGGGEIYKRFLSLADRIEITQINKYFENVDVYFPDLDSIEEDSIEEDFDMTTSELMVDEKTGLEYKYATLKRKEGA